MYKSDVVNCMKLTATIFVAGKQEVSLRILLRHQIVKEISIEYRIMKT